MEQDKKRYFAWKTKSPCETVYLGNLPNTPIAVALTESWGGESFFSEDDARAVADGHLIPDCPSWLRPFLARDLALCVNDVDAAKRWQNIIDFQYGKAGKTIRVKRKVDPARRRKKYVTDEMRAQAEMRVQEAQAETQAEKPDE